MAERRYTLVFYAALAIAAAATYGVYRTLEETKASGRIATAPVVVAAQDVPEGRVLDRIALTTRNWPVQALPAGAYSSIDSVAGRVTRVPVFKGEAFVPGRLAPAGTGGGLEVKIAPGKRAMSVKINDVAGISGLIQPNSRVDVLVNIRDVRATHEQQVAKLFMENMRVLSVGQQVTRGEDGKPINATTATLEVTPDEAERLAVAMNQGSIALVLRGYGDPDSIKTKGATSSDVLAQLREGRAVELEPKPAPSAPRRRPTPAMPAPAVPLVVQVAPKLPDSLTVQVYRGSKMSQDKFVKKSDSTLTRKP
ncbi:MAG: Flp pilus assembly protein CpaB [Gemmatimonadota bacterium]|nr:Flp pilus assembly protein CpaB [Gemmatimonadota bacterium]